MNHPNALGHVGASSSALQRLADEADRKLRAVQGQPISPVEVALGQIDAGLRDLRETVQRLSSQLGPVLSPISSIGPDGSTGTAGGPVPAAQAPLVDRVDALAAQLRQDCAALQDLERRLAL